MVLTKTNTATVIMAYLMSALIPKTNALFDPTSEINNGQTPCPAKLFEKCKKFRNLRNIRNFRNISFYHILKKEYRHEFFMDLLVFFLNLSIPI